MVKQEGLPDELRQKQRDRIMRQRASMWLVDCTIWHFARVTEQIDPALREGGIDVWLALADAQPAQTQGILLTEREGRWDILTYKTVQPIGHSSEAIQARFELLVADLNLQANPIWRSDQENVCGFL